MPHLRKALSNVLFLWVTPFLRRNSRTPLDEHGLIDLPVPDMVARDTEALGTTLAREGNSGILRLSLAIALAYRSTVLSIFGLSVILIVCTCLNPLLLRELLLDLAGSREAAHHSWLLRPIADVLEIHDSRAQGLLTCILLFASSSISIIAGHHIWHRQITLATRVKLSLSQVIYRKALRLHREERRYASSGFVINLVANDAQKIFVLVSFLHSTWTHPIMIGAVNILLYFLVGTPALWGATTLLLILFLSIRISARQSKARRELSSVADQRLGVVNETLLHIKTVKFQGWESRLSNRISGLRAREVALAKRVVQLSALSSFAATSAPALAMLTTFSLSVLSGKTLELSTIFPTLSLLLTLRFALTALPETLFNAVDAGVGMSRIRSFLRLRERLVESTTAADPCVVRITEATFEWEEDQDALAVTSLSIERGELVAVVGSVGSGKSALLLGILGELSKRSGDVAVGGSIAYVPQQPWILSETIRNNIICGAADDPELYARALVASGLEQDIAGFPLQDLTEIGERGVNLSGGQRQRLALARAFYQKADIYLLDDPLSALDPTVANHVFQELISKSLGNATRVLVTHRLEYALKADRVVVVEGGRIVEDGRPDSLKARHSRFAQLLNFHEQTTGTRELDRSPTTLRFGDLGDLGDTQLQSPIERTVVEEDRARGEISWETVRSYARRLLPGWTAALLLSVFVLRHSFSVLADLWLSTYSQRTNISVSTFLGGYVALVVLLCTFNLLRSLYLFSRGLAASISAHNDLLSGVVRAPLRFFEANPVGRILNRFSRDLDTIEQLLPRAVLDTLHCTLELATLLALIAIFEPIVLVLLSPILAYYYFTQRLFRPTSREAQRLESITRSPILALLAESLGGIDTIRASNLSGIFDVRFQGYLSTNGRAAYSLLCANRWLGIRLEMIGAFITLVGGTAAVFLSHQLIFTAAVGLMLTYALNISGAIHWLIRSISAVESNLTSFERLEHYAHIQPERLEGADPPASWPASGSLSFEGLTLRYRSDLPPAVKDFSCTIESGERIGIVGRTGSGKSTLLLGLMRLLEPSEGTIRLDSIDICSIRAERLRHAITVIPQEPVLFSGSLRENIDPFQRHPDTEIHTALGRVELGEFVNSLPSGLDTLVHESGSNFSSGQRQLLCLARALLEGSRIIVMDEATAHIDVETDYAIQRALRREFESTTVLIIAHRLGTILDSDRIIVLEDGGLLESGPPQGLLQQPNSALSHMVQEIRGEAA